VNEWLAGEDWVGQTRHHNQTLSDSASLISASVLLKDRIKDLKRPNISTGHHHSLAIARLLRTERDYRKPENNKRKT